MMWVVSILVGLAPTSASALEVSVRANAPTAVGVSMSFVATGSGQGTLRYTWNFGDGTSTEASTSPTATHVYAQPGHYPVIVIVRDEVTARSASFIQTVHRPLPASRPATSSTIVHDAARDRVCVTNPDHDSASCLSTQSRTRLFEAAVGRKPRTLALAPSGDLWVTGHASSDVTVLDPSGTVVDTLRFDYGSGPHGIAFSPTGDVAYVAMQSRGTLVRIATATRQIEAVVDVGPLPTGVSVSADGTRIFVTRFLSPSDHGEVVEVRGSDMRVVRRISLAMDPGPDGEANSRGVPNYLMQTLLSPDGAYAVVPSKKDNVVRGPVRDGLPLTFETSVRTIVSFIDLASSSEQLAQRIDLNDHSLGLSGTFSSLGDYFFVATTGTNGVQMVDAYSRNVVGGVSRIAGAPDGAVLDDEGFLYLHGFLSRSVVVVDARRALASVDFELQVVAEIGTVQSERLAADVLLGKRIFYDASDRRMARDGYISCATCHLDGFEDGRVWDFTDRGEGLRNTTSLLGRRGTGHGPVHWTANFDEIHDFEHDIRNAFGGTGFLDDALFGVGTRNTPLGDPKTGHSPELDALSAYVSSLDRVHDSPFRDSDGTLTEDGWAGRDLFLATGCADCHGGPDFTDSAALVLHDVGTLRPTSGKRLGETLVGVDTPTLRGIWQTAPYLHDGSAETLMDVITTWNPDDRHGRTSDLSTREREQLVAYLLQIDNVALEDERELPPPPPAADGGMAPSDAGMEDASSDGGAMETPAGGCRVASPDAPMTFPGFLLAVWLFGRCGRRATRRRSGVKLRRSER